MDLLQTCNNHPDLLDTFFATTGHAVFVTSLVGTVQYASPGVADVLGYAPEELLFRELSELFTPEDMTVFYPNLVHMAHKQRQFAGEVMLQRKDRSRFYAFMTFLPTGSGDHPGIVLVTVRNIDGQKTLEQEAFARTSEVMDQATADISTVVRASLAGVEKSVRRLSASGGENPEVRQSCQEIMKGTAGAAAAIKQYQELTSLQQPVLARESIGGIISEALAMAKEDLAGHLALPTSDVAEESLLLDRRLVGKALSAMLRFAAHGGDPDRRIHFSSENKDNQIRVFMTVSPSPVEVNEAGEVFNPFFRARHGAGAPNLAVVKRVMEEHQGDAAASAGEDGRLTVTLYFPYERRRYIRMWPL